MIESTIVFTHYALLLTATTSLLLGGILGWAVTNYVKRKRIDSLQSELKDIQIIQAEKSVARDTANRDLPSAAKMSLLSKKKDRLLKDFMKRQLQQKKSLDTANAELREVRKAKLLAERSLNAAHISLDQWKEKCTALAGAQTKLKKSMQAQTQPPRPSQKPNTNKLKQQLTAEKSVPTKEAQPAVILPVINISSKHKTAPGGTPGGKTTHTTISRPASTTAVSNTDKAPETAMKIIKPIDESAVTEVLSQVNISPSPSPSQLAPAPAPAPAATRTKRVSITKVKQTRLTTINGIGPAIEKELNKLGIQSVEQLATLKQKEINAIDKDLGKYSGRISRQEWVKQAKAQLKASRHEKSAA